ncbi:MAG: purine-binding chemotaxis protein CheW [Alphaproteobacteria bacterium]|nr:purine-binding chemotaxis protein CheW [Alphaproteobacteria bacterium]
MSMASMAAVPAAGPPLDDGATGTARQFVTFTVHGETFAVPLGEVQEIIRMPDLVRLPLSPPGLEGLANLRGAVLPVINLRTVFGCEAGQHDDSTRVVVLDQGRPVGLVVDRMANVVTVEADRIERAEAIRGSVESDLLTGMIKGADQTMVMILDAGALVRREVRSIGRGAGDADTAQDLRAGGAATDAAEGGDEIQLVSFVVAGQEYAFPIDQVQEIVQVPERITRVPNADAVLLGVITLRDRLLPLISLRSLFGLPAKEPSEQDRIVVLSLGRGDRDEMAVGVVMDSVKEVLRVGRSLADPVPPLLARDKHLQDMTAICRLDGGKRLVSVLSADTMFRNAAIRDAADAAAGIGGDPMSEDRAGSGQRGGADDEEQFVVFRLLAEEYGVAIDSVREIVRVPEQLTQIPRTPAFIEGVVNLRGTVLPVVDQRRRFGLPACERSDRQRIMVFAIHGKHTGFIVDSVSEVMRVPRAAIGPAPDLSEEQSRMIRRVANLEARKRMILLLDVDQLLDRGEVEEMAGA